MNKNRKSIPVYVLIVFFLLFTYFLFFTDYLHADNLLSIISNPFEYEKSEKNDLLDFSN